MTIRRALGWLGLGAVVGMGGAYVFNPVATTAFFGGLFTKGAAVFAGLGMGAYLGLGALVVLAGYGVYRAVAKKTKKNIDEIQLSSDLDRMAALHRELEDLKVQLDNCQPDGPAASINVDKEYNDFVIKQGEIKSLINRWKNAVKSYMTDLNAKLDASVPHAAQTREERIELARCGRKFQLFNPKVEASHILHEDDPLLKPVTKPVQTPPKASGFDFKA